jgi:hypothetical protein
MGNTAMRKIDSLPFQISGTKNFSFKPKVNDIDTARHEGYAASCTNRV